MVLYDTEKGIVLDDAFELMPGIWVNNGYRHICTDAQIGELGSGKRFALLLDDTLEVLAAKKRSQEIKPKEEQERARIAKEKRENMLHILLPRDGKMPNWYFDFIKGFNNVEKGKQAGIRNTAEFTRDQWLSYLCDSSFPSTFLAGYQIIRNFLSNTAVQEVYKNLKSVKIADVGCGNGGASLGGLTALVELLPDLNEITINAYDYSEEAMKLFEESLGFLTKKTDLSLKLNKKCVEFIPQNSNDRLPNQRTLKEFGEQVIMNNEFDFILSFKMINELIVNHSFDLSSTYYEMIHCLTPHLSNSGCLVVLDISMSAERDDDGNFIDNTAYGRALNKQSRCFEREHAQFKAVIPIPCSLIEKGCRDNGYCNQQRLFAAEDGRVFPATYKVIVRNEFAKKILDNIPKHSPKDYLVEETKNGIKNRCGYKGNGEWIPIKDRSCTSGETFYDGYDLNA